MLRGPSLQRHRYCGGCVKHKGAWQLIGLMLVIAVVSFVAGYFVMVRFIG